MAKIIIENSEDLQCENCHEPLNQSVALPYESRDTATGIVGVHYVCGNSCLTAVFNNHLQANDSRMVLSVTQFDDGLQDMPRPRGPLDD